MPRNARCVLPDVAYHITQRGTDRQPVFFTQNDRSVYTNLLRANLADAGLRVLAFCWMTNQIHRVAVPEAGDSLAVLFRRVHGRYAQYCNARRQRSGHLFQNRFFSCPLAEAHLWTALRYVELNPVRAGVADTPDAYPWSSAVAHLTGQDDAGLLDMAFWQQSGQAPAWRDLLERPDDPAQIRLLRRCTYAGRPFGDEAFLARWEERFQRKWRRWAYEAPLAMSPAAGSSARSLAHRAAPAA